MRLNRLTHLLLNARVRRRLACAALVYGLAVLLPSPAAGQFGWKTTDWVVRCSAEFLERLPTWACDPDNPTSPLSVASHQLREASRWLQDLGFGGPAITPYAHEDRGDSAPEPVPPYSPARRTLANSVDPQCVASYCATVHLLTGAHGVYWPDTHYLQLDPAFVLGGQAPFRLRGGPAVEWYRRWVDGYTPVHELFHAIQFGYEGVDADDGVDWITEGTAEFVQRVASQRWGTSNDPVPLHRQYDISLHQLPDADVSAWEYGSWWFWDFLGEHLQSRDRIQYLAELFQRELSPATNNGLDSLDEMLRTDFGTRGMFDLFPEFVRSRLNDACFFSDLARFQSRRCERLPQSDNVVELSALAQRAQEVVDMQVEPMAAEAWLVRTEVSRDKVAGLSVQLLEPYDADPKYHLIVGDTRADLPDPSGRRNRHLALLDGGRDSVLVRVANAPRDVSRALGRGSMAMGALEFKLEELEGCDGEAMWSAIHPEVRERLRLVPPAEYEQRYRREPELRPSTGLLRIDGLVSDGGVACVHPVSASPNPDVRRPADASARGSAMRERIESMSQGEMMEMARRMAERMQGRQDRPPSPEHMLDDVLAAMNDTVMDSLVDRSTWIQIFSPNAISWQRPSGVARMQGGNPAGALVGDGPMVPYAHPGIGGWSENSGAELHLFLGGVAPEELHEDSTYAADATLTYRRGDASSAQRRVGIAAPGSPGLNPSWQPMEGEFEQLGPSPTGGALPFRGRVRILEITGAAIRGEFTLTGIGHLLRSECPKNPLNLGMIQRRCQEEQAEGSVTISGRFVAPTTRIERSR